MIKFRPNIRRLISACLACTFVVNQSSIAALATTVITPGGAITTDTHVNTTGNVTDITTGTTVKNGSIGVNSFSRFNVGAGDVVNLKLQNSQNKLVNLIFDSSASEIYGVVNSYLNNKIGGNILFANPHGFVVGSSGVFNVGSLTLMTPKEDSMKELANGSGGLNEENVERLISFKFDDNDYLVSGNKYTPFVLDTGRIDIAGKINSAKGIDLISGAEVNLQKGSELNANMTFSTENGNVVAKASSLASTLRTSGYSKNLAMQDGNDIVIVASNNAASKDVLSAIVNLDGKVNANGGNVIARTEVFQTDKKSGDAKSEINVNTGAEINANNIYMNAVSKISDVDKNVIGVSDLSEKWYYGYLGDVVNYVVDECVHLAQVDTAVNINKGAQLTAENDVKIGALSDMDISASALLSTLPNFNLNITDLGANTSATVKNGATIKAKNLSVNATTDLKLDTTTKTTNLDDILTEKNIGSYALGVTVTNLTNNATIENGATLDIKDNIDVVAKTSSYQSDIVKNGLIPVIDKNHGPLGAAMSFIFTDVKNNAVMNADANISGKLNVEADYTGNVISSVAAYSGTGTKSSFGTAEDGFLDGLLTRFSKVENIDKVVTRGNAQYNNIDTAAGVGVISDKVVSSATIGDSSKNIKPNITAGQVQVKSELKDEKSTLYVTGETEQGRTSASGAIAVNYKDLTSNANAYGDFVLKGSTAKDAGDALSITAKTDIVHPMAWLDWFETFAPFFEGDTWSDAFKEVKEHWKAVQTNSVGDYLQYLESLAELKSIMDKGGFDMFKAIDFNNLGAYGFFSTFAQSKANAMAQTGQTKALSGAVGISLFNANANAALDNNSTVKLQTTNAQNAGITVSAESDNDVWTAATLMDLMQFTKFLSGATARDGSAYGVGGAFSYSDSHVTARIGEGVNITKDDDDVSGAVYGDINVKAVENGNFLTVSAGSSSPDNTGLSGAVGMTVLGDGVVKAAIENGANIFGNNVNVSAAKDDNFINAVIAFANGQKSYGFGLSGIILTDSVESYIAGNVTASDSVNVSADYDKFLINANANIGVAKNGTDEPEGQLSQDQIDNYYGLRELFDDGSETETTPETSPSTPSNELHWYNFVKKHQAKSDKIQELADQANTGFDFTRNPNPKKDTKAYAGGVNLDVANNSVKAQIKDGATVSAENDVKVNANSHDKIIDANAVASANGKSGAGATIMADVTLNNVEASIGKATVNANKAIEVTAGEDYDLIAASAGVAVEKDKSGAGNVSSAVQVNNVTAAIDGATINDTATGDNQSVKVEGKVDSNVIKAVGALSVQAGSDSGKSVGATLDADIVSNTINSYIKGATVNANGNIDVNALNTDKIIVVDAAGGVSTSGSAYSGTIGVYVAANEVNSYIENSTVNSKNGALNLKASSSFDEIAVVGTVGAGSKTGVGMSVRVDAVINELNSYIKGSTIKTAKTLTMTNSDSMSQISVGVGGSASTDGSGGAGALSVLADVTDQNNYIENSTVNVGSLTMDSDKTLDTLSVTGALSLALGGASVGISAYALGASHNINTYIKNSDITATSGNIQLTSDFKQDNLSIIFGGAGGKGVTVTGALNVLVNDSTLNTYVLSETEKKQLSAQKGLIKVASSSDVNSLTIDGNVGISTGSVSAGGAVNTTVNNSTVTAGIKGADVKAGKGVEVAAKSNQKYISTAVGASVGSVGVEGTVDTVVMNQNIKSYIDNSNVNTEEGDITVNSDSTLNLTSGVGGAEAGTGGAGVGGAVQTLVINQTIDSEIKNSTLKAVQGSIKNQSSSDFDLLATVLGFSGASSAAINGSVATQVLNINAKSEISSSVLEAAGDILNTSTQDTDIQTYIASANGAGTAAIGGVVYSIVDNSSANALINGTNTIKTANTLQNTSSIKSSYLATLFNASGSGTAAVNGTVSTFVLNSQANAIVDGVTGAEESNIGAITVQSDNTSKATVAMLEASGSGSAAVNGGVNTFVSSKKSKAQINNSNITSTGKVTVSANADNKIDSTVVGGAGSGGVAITGAVNTIVSSDEISAKVSDSTISAADFSASAKDTLSIVGRTGSLQGAGGVAAGGAIITGVITNSVEALVENSDITSKKDITISSVASETLGDSKNPFITIAASGSGSAAVAGAVDTLVLNSSSKAKVSGKKANGLSAVGTLKLEGTGNTDIFLAAGGAGGGSVGVGATASTLVIDKDIEAVADNTKISSKDIDIDASSTDNISTVAVAGAIGAVAGVSGAVNTTVISSDVKAGISKSEVAKTGDINIDSKVSAKYLNTTGAASGSGVAGVGASVVTNVVGYNTSAFIDNSTVQANNIAVKSDAATTYNLYAISGAVGGEAGVAGVVETNVVNNSVTSYVTGDITANNKLEVNAKDEVNFNGIAGTLAGAGGAGVGATIQTNSVTSTVLSYIGGNNITAADIDVNAEGVQNFNDLSALGFSGGQVGVNGSALSNIVDATVKSYITKDSTVTSTADLDVTAKNTTTITEAVGSGSLGLYASVGASVGVNKITNTTEAYTEDNVTLNAKTADFDAQTTVKLGKEGNELELGAGSVGVGAGVAGAVLVNDIETKTAAYTGKKNTITASESLSLKAQNDTTIYEKIGAAGVGLGSIGASVGVNTIYNTVISSIGQGTTINQTDDVGLSAISNETIVANAAVVGGGGIALGGGIIHNTIGKSVDNAQANDLTGDDAKSYDSAKKQSEDVLKASEGYKKDADNNFKKYYNDASKKASSSIADANKNINSSLKDSLKDSKTDASVNVEAGNVEQKDDSFSMFTKSANSGSSYGSTDRNDTTSAFVDSGANIKSNNLTVSAKDTNDVKIDIDGNTYGALAVGVSAAVSNVNTTTNAFLSSGVTVTSSGTIDINAESVDKQTLDVNAASGGIVSGNGAVAKANSNKNTNAYILNNTMLTSTNDLNISAKSTGEVNSEVKSGAYSGVSVGTSIADAIIKGETKVDAGENVTIQSTSGNINVTAETDEKATANAKAASGSLLGGSGAEATAQAGKTNTVKIGKNANILSKLAATLSSTAKNTVNAETDGRAYGGVSAGGTKTTANVDQTSGVEIADADKKTAMNVQSLIISSTAENNVNAKTNAGAGAAVGISGSGVYTNIKSTNKAYVGKNYQVKTTDGAYNVVADTKNTYKSFNNSSSYGAITDATAIIGNTVNSVVSAGSNADIEANGEIAVLADNEVKKEADSNYDLLGGAGAVVGVGTASLTDDITMETTTVFGGDYAHSTGKFDSGFVNIASQSILDVNEKVDVNADGAIPVASGNTKVSSKVTTKTDVSNKDVTTNDDDIYYLANSEIKIYTKSNVESYGGIAVADGESSISDADITNAVTISGVKSVSGRDTYVQSTVSRDIQAYMYAQTEGFVGAVGDSTAKAHYTSNANITIDKDSKLQAYDSMNLAAIDTKDNFTVKRDAKGTTRALFGIPIVTHGSGHEDKQDTTNASIVLNGSVESGLGAEKSLTIDKDGKITSKGIGAEEQKVGSVTSSDTQADIEAYTKSKESELKRVDDLVNAENTIAENAKTNKASAESKKSELVSKNESLESALNIIDKLIKDNDKAENVSALEIILAALEADDGGADDGSISKFEELLKACGDDEDFASVKDAFEAYKADKGQTEENLNSLSEALDALGQKIQQNKDSSIEQLGKLTEGSDGIASWDNKELTTFKATQQSQISENEEEIGKCDSAISAAEAQLKSVEDILKKAEEEKAAIEKKYDDIIAELQKQKESGQEIPVYSIVVDETTVRSGEVNITGNVTGNGSITAPGNKFSITVENNSVSDVVYNGLKIDKNAKGDINIASGSTVASSVKQKVNHTGDAEYKISVKNTVDGNDPTIGLGLENGYGDMVFMGDIENVNGLVELENNTGNILSQGSITTRDLKISVPNGAYTQEYSGNTLQTGGEDGKGAIVASGDIDIASKVIDLNGLVQSGSEIKSLTIPNFSVVKENGKYYQVVNGKKVEMKAGATDGYYYLDFGGTGEADSDLTTIKAYFKPDANSPDGNVNGEIYLFKAEIQGGNITLTGNVISSSQTGKIVLVNGYGHIDVVNNSNFDLVTSALNADTKVQGKLTINDFKFDENDKAGSKFDNLNDKTVKDPSWLEQNAGTYTAFVDENGKVQTSSSGQTEGNGYWGSVKTDETREDGAKVYYAQYNPGNDAYIVTEDGSVETKSYQVYVKRSWWTELWHGKLYKTVTYTVTHDPKYGTAKNAVSVQFQGFDTPEINVQNNGSGSIVLNGSVSALGGNVTLDSAGDIENRSLKNTISAKNIDLEAEGDIGSELFAIQTSVYGGGKLTANGNNIYINFPYEDISNVDITAQGLASLSTDASLLGGKNSNIKITADTLELKAASGSIDLDASENKNIDINIKKLKAVADGDISITDDGDLTVQSIVSRNQGTIKLTSLEGSILATDTGEELNPFNIDGGNVILSAVKGSVGSSERAIKFARDGIFNVEANGDVNLSSAGRIYADLIKSTSGSVTLDADYGIIASSSNGSDLVYDIYSAKGVNLNTKFGNIENIAINTDGVVNASAGYSDAGIASGLSDISITLISKAELTEDELKDMTEAEQKAAYEDYIKGLKDMKVGKVKASKNVFIHSEKSILSSDENSSIEGEQIVLSAKNGDIGTDDMAINLNANRDISAYAGDGASVYLTSDKDLKINEIRSYKTYGKSAEPTNDDYELKRVVLKTKGNITNAAIDADKANVSANDVVLEADKDIGTKIKYFNVDAKSSTPEDGLTFGAYDAYINGVGDDLNIVSSDVKNDTYLTSDEGLDINIENSTFGNNLTVETKDDITVKDVAVKGELNTKSKNFNDEGNLSVDKYAGLTADDSINIKDAQFNDNVAMFSKSTHVDDMEVAKDAILYSDDEITVSDSTVGGNFDLSAPDINIKDMNVKGNLNAFADNLDVHSSNDINIGYVAGRTEDYTTSAKVSSDKSIKNGKESEQDTNIYGKDIELSAGQSVGEDDKDLSLKLAKDNNVTLKSKDSLSVSASGEAGNFSDIVTDELDLTADNDVNVKNLKFKNGKVKTNSHNLSIDNMDIEELGDFTTADKHIIVDNSGFRPHFDADVQLHVTKTPASLYVDSSNNVITEAQNVVRKDSDIFIDGLENYNSMDTTIDALSEAAIKNTRTGKKTSDTNEEILYGLPTLKAYTQETESAIEGIIRNQLGEFVTPENVFDSVNISENKRKKFKDFDFSKNENNKKLSLTDKKEDNYEN